MTIIHITVLSKSLWCSWSCCVQWWICPQKPTDSALKKCWCWIQKAICRNTELVFGLIFVRQHSSCHICCHHWSVLGGLQSDQHWCYLVWLPVLSRNSGTGQHKQVTEGFGCDGWQWEAEGMWLCHRVGHRDARQGKDLEELRTTLTPEKQHL